MWCPVVLGIESSRESNRTRIDAGYKGLMQNMFRRESSGANISRAGWGRFLPVTCSRASREASGGASKGRPDRIPSRLRRMQWLAAQPGSIGWCGFQVLPRLFYIARGPARGSSNQSSRVRMTQVPGASCVRVSACEAGGTPPVGQTRNEHSEDLTHLCNTR